MRLVDKKSFQISKISVYSSTDKGYLNWARFEMLMIDIKTLRYSKDFNYLDVVFFSILVFLRFRPSSAIKKGY